MPSDRVAEGETSKGSAIIPRITRSGVPKPARTGITSRIISKPGVICGDVAVVGVIPAAILGMTIDLTLLQIISLGVLSGLSYLVVCAVIGTYQSDFHDVGSRFFSSPLFIWVTSSGLVTIIDPLRKSQHETPFCHQAPGHHV